MSPQSPRYFVNDEHRFIYCVVPKVACSSIKVALAPLFGIDPNGVSDTPGEANASEDIHTRYERAGAQINQRQLLRRLGKGMYSDYFIFAFVRDPRHRLYSCWLQKLSTPKSQGFVNMEYPTAGGSATLWRGMSFAEFVEAVAAIPDEESNLHWMSQSRMLLNNGSLLPEFVGYFESLSHDFAALAKRLGLSSHEMPHLLSSGGNSREACDEHTYSLLTNRYADDLALFYSSASRYPTTST